MSSGNKRGAGGRNTEDTAKPLATPVRLAGVWGRGWIPQRLVSGEVEDPRCLIGMWSAGDKIWDKHAEPCRSGALPGTSSGCPDYTTPSV
jgi:hypothetical protein